jgi:hypothetical protein
MVKAMGSSVLIGANIRRTFGYRKCLRGRAFEEGITTIQEIVCEKSKLYLF